MKIKVCIKALVYDKIKAFLFSQFLNLEVL
jgi:hypothetical protein